MTQFFKVHEVESYKAGFTSELFFTQELIDMNLADNIIKNDNLYFKATPMKVFVCLDSVIPLTIQLKETLELKCFLENNYVRDLDYYENIARNYEVARKHILSKQEYVNMREVRNLWANLLDTLRFMKLVNEKNFNFSELTKELTFEDVRNFKTELESIVILGYS